MVQKKNDKGQNVPFHLHIPKFIDCLIPNIRYKVLKNMCDNLSSKSYINGKVK